MVHSWVLQIDNSTPKGTAQFLELGLEVIEHDVVREAFEDQGQFPVWVDPVAMLTWVMCNPCAQVPAHPSTVPLKPDIVTASISITVKIRDRQMAANKIPSRGLRRIIVNTDEP